MYITLETDYAIRIILFLCKENKRIDAGIIAKSTGVTLRFALKILRKLVFKGLLKSFKGVSGGYQIAKDPKDITLLAVVETIAGEYQFSRCVGEGYDCNNPMNKEVPICQVKKKFQNVTNIVRCELESITFDEFLQQKDKEKV